MIHPEIEIQIMMERRRDELAAAEHSRLVKAALEAQKEYSSFRDASYSRPFFQTVLHRVGQGLFLAGLRIQAWGCQLQVRYAAAGAGGRAAPCK